MEKIFCKVDVEHDFFKHQILALIKLFCYTIYTATWVGVEDQIVLHCKLVLRKCPVALLLSQSRFAHPLADVLTSSLRSPNLSYWLIRQIHFTETDGIQSHLYLVQSWLETHYLINWSYTLCKPEQQLESIESVVNISQVIRFAQFSHSRDACQGKTDEKDAECCMHHCKTFIGNKIM